MTKVQIIGPKGLLDECIKVLHALAVVHIETVPEAGAEESFIKRLPLEKEKLKEREFLEKAADRLKNLLLLLKEPQSYRTPKVSTEAIAGLLDELAPVEEDVKALRAKVEALGEELSAVSKYERLLKGFAPIVSRLGGLKNFDIIGLTIEKTRVDIVDLLNSEVERITGGSYEIHAKDLDETTTGVVLTYPSKFAPKVRYLLSGKSISEIRLPDEYEKMTLIEALKQMSRKKAELPGLIAEAERRIEEISGQWYARVSGLYGAVQDALDEIGVITYAAQTRFTFVIEGWVPADMFAPLKEKFHEMFGDRTLVRELEIEEREYEMIPVHIENSRIFKPFEVFLAALPPPRYGSVDPTPYVAFFFPAFFGLIVADIGYGLVILLLSLYLKRRFAARAMLRDMAQVMVICSLTSILFGALFGELFGDLGSRLGLLHPIVFHRIEALKTLIVLTLGIGLGHVVLGFVIGTVNHLYRGNAREAGAKIAHLTLIISFLVMLGVMLNYLPRGLLTPGVVSLVVAFVLLMVIEGVLGPLEFLKTLGNILSYVRIMAVGTASVVMAIVANRIGGLSEDLILGIIAAALIHTLNIMLSVLSPAIQSMRLHYVEFFSKFYEGGGREYRPFKKR